MNNAGENNNESNDDESLYIPEENQTSNAGGSCLLALWYVFLTAVGILVLGFVALFVVCMV